MKNVPVVANALRTNHNVVAVPKATIEWNMNRYHDLSVLNIVSEVDYGNDVDIFPIESIVEPWRPTKGINKARIGYGYAASNYNDWPTARFYVASDQDKYKYWMSPFPSDVNRNLPNCAPQVVYSETVQVNKIKVVVEDTWASPEVFAIQYSTDGGYNWITASSTARVQNDGTIEVFWNGSEWTDQRPGELIESTGISGIRFLCTRLRGGRLRDGSPTRTRVSGNLATTTGQGSYLSVIEMAACLVRDVTDLIVSTESSFDSGDSDVISPVGTLTTNTGSITMWNRDENGKPIFSRDNLNSPYRKLIEQNAEVTSSIVYEVDTRTFEIQQFKLYADSWEDSDDGVMTVSLSDASKHLKEVKPNAAKYENMRFTEIMYRLCDAVGWNNYNVNMSPQANDIRVPIFWTDGEQTLWEILDDLARVSQSVIYFDEFGMMNVKTREDAFSPNAAPVWNLRAENSGTELADIVSLDSNGEFGSNSVKIVYRDTKWADQKNGFAEYSPVWEAEDPTVLRSSPLLFTLEPNAERFQMSPPDASTWPHTGFALIEGEVIEYDAKMFVYQSGGRQWWTWVSSQAEHDHFNNQVQSSLRYRNYYDGQFRIKQRGAWNTPVTRHSVDIEGYGLNRYTVNGHRSGGGLRFDRRESQVNIRTAGMHNSPDEYLILSRGVPGDSPWRYIGTKMTFNSGNAQHQAAGIAFNLQGERDGYYVELCPTSQISEKDREVRNEVAFYIRKNGRKSQYWPGKGATAPVAIDNWGELDVWYSPWGQRIKIFYRGTEVLHFNIPGGWELNPSGKFALFARGSTDASFEYLYASSNFSEPEPSAQYSSVHALDGMATGRSFKSEWIHRNTRRQRQKRKKTNKAVFDKRQRFMDEFGPYIHELKEFEVKFDPAPVQNSFLYNTNTWAAEMIDYRADSFGAVFTMVNTERYNSILSGEDKMLSPGTDSGPTQQLVVFGRGLVIEEGEEVTAKNEQQIRARGEILTEIDSNWIQSKDAAQEIADWIINHWSSGVDEASVTIFGNPLFQIGDIVAVEFPEKEMFASTHHYFVTGISHTFDTGLTTTLTIRRRN